MNNEYDEQFGLTTVDGKPVQMEDLRTGVGNIFAQASNLFRWADSIGINVDSVAAGIAQAGALITQGQGLLNEATGEATGTPTRPLTETLTPLPPDFGGTPTRPLTGTLAPLPPDFGGTPTRPLTETLAPPAPGTGQPDIAALGRALSGGNLDLAAAGAALGLNTDAILSAVNLNTLGMEIDRVLEQVGLELRQGDVYLNRLGAEQLNAQPGDVLDIFIGPIPVPFRVRAVVEQAGPLGALKPVVMLRLDEAQELLFMPGRVNNVLVSNTGDAYTGMENTAAAARQLRALALNEDALTELLALLREPDMLAAIAAGADGSAPSTLSREEADMADFMAFIGGGGGGMGNVALAERTPRLVAELTGAGVSPELRVLVAQPDMQNWLRRLPLPGETSVKLNEILGRISDLEVLDVLSKNTVVAAAGIGGTVFTTVFTIFGIFSIFAGVLLIFLIFVMLAAERRSEMGMARAIGMQRGHLVQMFVSEGMIYDLVAAALGIVLGLAISYAMIGFLGGIFNTAAQQVSSEISSSLFTFHFNVAPTSVVIAYALGVLLTFAVVTVSSWRVSRLNIVSAILDTPEPDGGGRGAGKLIGRLITGPLTVAAGAWLTFGVAGGGSGVLLLIALSMLLVGGLLSVSWALSATSMRTERRRRLVYTVIGLGLVLIWGLPWETLLPGRGFGLLQQDPRWTVLSLVVKGPALILGGILVIMFSADILLQAVSRALGGIGADAGAQDRHRLSPDQSLPHGRGHGHVRHDHHHRGAHGRGDPSHGKRHRAGRQGQRRLRDQHVVWAAQLLRPGDGFGSGNSRAGGLSPRGCGRSGGHRQPLGGCAPGRPRRDRAVALSRADGHGRTLHGPGPRNLHLPAAIGGVRGRRRGLAGAAGAGRRGDRHPVPGAQSRQQLRNLQRRRWQ
ncbi:ABC transporter permease [Candidatus Amarolinea dominans]|uniref:ABC transporter permease n=1 Tax=Candidatus Amarolinea dominans TaxID=3140696 RepID=UPI003135DEF0|nr:ABC transporter permease [Anaerolineae bacterium]